MEHRPLPYRSAAMRRYLNETPYEEGNHYGRRLAADSPDQWRYYITAHESQLNKLQQLVSRRKKKLPTQFPFLCVFHFAGCDRTFENIWEWKDHVVSEHLGRATRVYWQCTEGNCAHAAHAVSNDVSLQTNDYPEERSTRSSLKIHPGRLFENKHDFRTHLIDHHLSIAPDDRDKHIKWLLRTQNSSMRTCPELPQKLSCPMPKCASSRFVGPTAWDQRLNHAAEHFLTVPQCVDVFGGMGRNEIVQWALKAGIVEPIKLTRDAARVLLAHDCDKSMADSGYGSMQGSMQEHVKKSSVDETSATPTTGNRAEDDFLQPIASESGNQESHSSQLSVPASTLFALNSQRAETTLVTDVANGAEPTKDTEAEETVDATDATVVPDTTDAAQGAERLETDEGSSSNTSIVESPDHALSEAQENAEKEAFVQWLYGWLREHLAPSMRPQGSGGETGQTTNTILAGHDQNSGPSSSASSQNKKKTRRRRVPKRKRDDDSNDGKDPKTQCRNDSSDQPPFACLFFKHNPREYSQPGWYACMHGFDGVNRVKQHLQRNHALPRYQCRRCSEDLQTPEALDGHVLEVPACTPRINIQDGLRHDQFERMLSRASGKKTEAEKWKEMYQITFPNEDIPSPYLYDTDKVRTSRELNLYQEYNQSLLRELPPRVGEYLATFICQLSDSMRDDVERSMRRIISQAHSSILRDMGYATINNGEQPANEQLDNGSANDGTSMVETVMSSAGNSFEEASPDTPITLFLTNCDSEESPSGGIDEPTRADPNIGGPEALAPADIHQTPQGPPLEFEIDPNVLLNLADPTEWYWLG